MKMLISPYKWNAIRDIATCPFRENFLSPFIFNQWF